MKSKTKFGSTIMVLSFVLTALLLQSCATMTATDLTPERSTISEIVEIPGITKDDFFVRANSWMVDNFVNAESVIEYTDKEAGVIKGKYVMSGLPEGVSTFSVRSTITIETKEGKVRITITDPYRKYTTILGDYKPNMSYKVLGSKTFFEEKCLPSYLKLIESFKNAITTASSTF
jgi:hypothetical protein